VSIPELFAVIFGLFYLFFVLVKKRIAWYFGILSSLIYIFVFWESKLFLQSYLQIFYIGIGIFGLINWGKTPNEKPKAWPIKYHLLLFIIGFVISLILGIVFKEFQQQYPYFDAFISVFCLLATFLTAKSILENWYYWIVLNLLSIILFHLQELYLTEILFLFNFCMSIFGLLYWKKLAAIPK